MDKEPANKTPEWEKADRMVEDMIFKSIHTALARRMEVEEITTKLGENKNATEEEKSHGAEEAKKGNKAVKREGWQTLPEAEEKALLKRAMKYQRCKEGGPESSQKALLHSKWCLSAAE